jgi:filamentous hemagglutinin family protein
MLLNRRFENILNQKEIAMAFHPFRLMTALTLMTTGLAAISTVARAELPTNGTVVAGSANIASTGGTTTIDQFSQRTVIDWTTYNISSNGTVIYNQPNASALAINRVTGGDPSKIYGTLKSNGIVMILDRNGVLFGANARIDVGGIIASTGDISSAADAMNAALPFTLQDINANPAARIDNKAVINVADAGLLAFVGPYVRNYGTINARLGRVTLASGSRATLDFTGDGLVQIAANDTVTQGLVRHAGAIYADGGVVALTANAASGVLGDVINTGGIIRANAVALQDGKIVLSGGTGGRTVISGHLSAGGGTTVTAGTVNIGGKTYLDQGGLTINADKLHLSAKIVDATTDLNVDASRLGDGVKTAYIMSSAASIQQGLDLAADYGTVYIHNGSYKENLTVGKSVRMMAAAHDRRPVISGAQSGGAVITVTGAEAYFARLIIDGGTKSRGGIVSDYGIYADGVTALDITNQIAINNIGKSAVFITDSGVLPHGWRPHWGHHEVTYDGNGGFTSGHAYNIVVSGIFVDGTGGNAFEVQNSSNVFIRPDLNDHSSSSTGLNGINITNSDQIAIAAGAVYSIAGTGVYAKDSSNIFIYGTGFSHQIAAGSSGDGIDMEDVDGLLISHNGIDNAPQYGIFLKNVTGAAEVSVNHTTGSGIAGFGAVNSPSVVVSGNTFN